MQHIKCVALSFLTITEGVKELSLYQQKAINHVLVRLYQPFLVKYVMIGFKGRFCINELRPTKNKKVFFFKVWSTTRNTFKSILKQESQKLYHGI